MQAAPEDHLCRSCLIASGYSSQPTEVSLRTLVVVQFVTSSMIFLETERLVFRSHEEKDEADFVRMQMDSEVRRYMGGRGWPLEKAHHRFRNEYLGRPTETYGFWAAVLKEEEKYIECCGLRSDRDGAHLGYTLAKPYWRRGFASEACRGLIDIGFGRLSLPRILADVEEGNAASEHILMKFGFRYVSREKIPSSGRVILLCELLRVEWGPRPI
jgi:RimJ/RimL family protein N-acetyltransferase